MMMKKKGVSEVIATVLVILIAVVAVVLISSILIPMIKNQLQSSQQCFGTVGQLSILKDVTCWEDNGDRLYVGVQLNKQGDYPVANITITYGSKSGSSASSMTEAPVVGGFTVFNLSATTKPDVIQISPTIYVPTDKIYRTCDVADTYNTIPIC